MYFYIYKSGLLSVVGSITSSHFFVIRQSQGFWSRFKKVIKQNGSYFKEPLKKMFAQCIVHAKTLLQDLKAHASFVYFNDLYITVFICTIHI